MKILLGNIDEILNIDDKIDNSFNGTCFAYSWFLELKNSKQVLKIYNDRDELLGFMPVFWNKEKVIFQSTMYIPYGGPVIFDVPQEERNKIRYIRQIEKTLINYLQENYCRLDFSIDDQIIDIMPFIRSGFSPEIRYTYKLDLKEGLDNIYKGFGSDRKKDIRRAEKRNIEFIVDNRMHYFDVKKAMKWEKNYGTESTVKWVEKYIRTTIEKEKGMCFVAKEGSKIIGAVHIAWDNKTSYILYSYYETEHDDVAIAFIYYKMIEYLIDNNIGLYLDFEGSVFETIEDWNISFGAYQSRFYNLHWNNKNEPYLNLYDYGEKDG